MDELKRVLPLLAIVLVVIGITMLSNASTELRRAALVEEIPATIDCETLIREGTPDNRHVRVTDCWFGNGWATSELSDNRDWDYVYMPLYPLKIAQEGDGRDIRLIACFKSVRTEEELHRRVGHAEVTGFIWDEQNVLHESRQTLLGYYPRIDFQQCRIIEIGAPLPTPARARMYQYGAVLLFSVAAVLAIRSLYKFAGQRLGLMVDPKDRDPYVAESPAQQPLPHRSEPSFVHVICVRFSAVVLPLAAVAGLAFYLGMWIGIVDPDLGHTGMVCSLGVLTVTGGLALFSCRDFRHYAHERVEPHELSVKARRYFSRHTPALEQLGFQHIADVRIHSDANTLGRHFLSPDRKTLAVLASNFGVSVVSFQSVADDSVCLETSNLEVSNLIDQTLPQRYQVVKAPLKQIWAAHQQMVGEYEAENRVAALAIKPDEIPAVLDYEHRVSGWSLFRTGYHRSPPPPLPRFGTIEMLKDLLSRGMPIRAKRGF